jgi:hypothetical protein
MEFHMKHIEDEVIIFSDNVTIVETAEKVTRSLNLNLFIKLPE